MYLTPLKIAYFILVVEAMNYFRCFVAARQLLSINGIQTVLLGYIKT